MRILYKYASRSRPDNFFRGCRTINKFSHDSNYHILATLDNDDELMTSLIVKEELIKVPNMTIAWGTSANKIHAINRDMDKGGAFDILVCMSDDMIFLKHGFDNTIRNDMQTYFPDTDGMLHYNDGNRGDLITMSIKGRKYYERFNYLYHPSYISLWCDNESTDVAKLSGKYKYMGDDRVIFNHLHPAYQLAKMDKQYIKTEAFMYEDMENYKRRKADNFPV